MSSINGTDLPVELVESQFDLAGVRFPVAASVTKDLLDAPDTKRLRRVQVRPFNVVRRFPVVLGVQIFIDILLPVGAFHWTGWLHADDQNTSSKSQFLWFYVIA